MGVSVEEYRCRIGCFKGAAFTNSLKKSCKSGSRRTKSLFLLPAAALVIFLLASGIEPNPGPEFFCKLCKSSFNLLKTYYRHIGIHQFESTFHCPISDCSLHYASVRSLQSHISRDHRSLKSVTAVNSHVLGLQCPIPTCGISLSSREDYLKHMPTHLREGITFNCSYPQCNTFVGTIASFRTHVSQCHSKEVDCNLQEFLDTSSNSSVSVASNDHGQLSQDSSKKSEQNQSIQGIDGHEIPAEGGSQVFTEYAAKDQLAKFYLMLEGVHFLPTSTVQIVADEIKLVTEMSHYFLKNCLKSQLKVTGLDEKTVIEIVDNTFRADPVYNIHHKKEDVEHLGTDHLRQKFWKKHYPYVEPKEIFLGYDQYGRKKRAHHVSIRESIEVMLQDPKVKKMVLDSFKITKHPHILTDFTDGTAFTEHMLQHHGGKCIYINLYQDGFDYAAFGPSQGVYKSIGFYFALGNIKPEYRTKVDLIQMVYMVLEKHLKGSEKEELEDTDTLKQVLKPLTEELEELKEKGISIDGEEIPVCLLFSQGDNLGQHFIGGFVGSFSCQHCCRFCQISLDEFRGNPTWTKPLRTSEEYDSCVKEAKKTWLALRDKSLETAAKKRQALAQHQVSAPGSKSTVKRILSKHALQKLRGVHCKGVKYRPSPLNSEKLKFHVCKGPALPVCIAHDIFEGIAKNMIPKILSHFMDKEWFDFETLNRRIKGFPYEGSDLADIPTPLKSLTALAGNASENWTLIRLLPLIIGDLIQDSEDEMWQLFLKLKTIVEYVFAPKITVNQVLYLKSLIREYLLQVQAVFPQFLWPKQHLLMHYPDLIIIFGPLVRLFTLRFESKHVFFKNVAKACKNFINISYTLSRKYMCRFAYDYSSLNLLEEDVLYQRNHSSLVIETRISKDIRAIIPHEIFSDDSYISLSQVSVKGVTYKVGYLMILDSVNQCDLQVGLIDMIFLNTSTGDVSFLMNVKPAANSFQGYFKIMMPASSYLFSSLDKLPDYHPLSSYTFNGQQCISLKHTMIKM